MIFTKVELRNYGLFKDATLDLRPKRDAERTQNIVLFGGKNGSGKTTLLEAVRLCLYGQRSRGARVRRKDYEAFLRGRLHRPRSSSSTPDSALVALEFEHIHAGEKTKYRVERSWRDTGSAVEESFRVSSAGDDQQELTFDQEHWEQFIQELIPPGVSQLFFFDGEKIQGLAEEDGVGSELAHSINSLLGLDLAKRLDADLGTYLRRQESTEGASNTIEQLDELERAVESAQEELNRLKQERAQTEVRLRAQSKKIDKVERRIAREGGSYARHREELIGRRAAAEEAVDKLSNELRGLCEGLLPFAVVPELCQALEESLEGDATLRRAQAVRDLVESRMSILRDRIASTVAFPVEGEAPEDMVEREVRAVFLESSEHDRRVPLHPVSSQTAARLMEASEQARTGIPVKAGDLLRQLERSSRELTEVQTALGRAPKDDVLRPLLDELRGLHEETAEVHMEATEQDEAIEATSARLEQLERDRRKERERLKSTEGLAERVRLVARVQSALEAFAERVKEQRLKELTEHFRACFGALARKEDMVSAVEIEPETYKVAFLDEEGRSLPKSELSAGEKQIYAIAMLWALARTSRRPLPFLIDTPLGRLDSEHRANLVREYFPHVAHQVVILSTDTEIDRPYFEELEPYIARAYHLSYNGATNSTDVETGYFWENTGECDEVEPTAA